MRDFPESRRSFLYVTAALGASAAISGVSWGQTKPESKQAEVSPTEDLMREHGVLRRILLIYDDLAPKLARNARPDPKVIATATGIIRKFIEDYHEKLEEDFLFPRFEKAGRLADLVKVLRQQHQVGRGLTSDIERLATAGLHSDTDARRMAEAMAEFKRMYRPHAAREDTVLFPALHELVSAKEFDSLGDQFEDKERELFGKDGFETMVGRVAELEKQVGLYELAQFSRPATSNAPKP